LTVGVRLTGERLILTEPDGPVTEYDTRSGQPIGDWTGLAAPMVASRDRSRIAAVRGNTVVVMNSVDRTVLHTLTPASLPVEMLDFAADGSQLALTGRAGVEVWDLNSGTRRHHWTEARGWVRFGSLPHQLVTCSTNEARIWDTRTGEIRNRWPAHQGLRIAFSEDGRRMATVVDHTVTLRDGDGVEMRRIPIEPGLLCFPQFSPDGTQLALGVWWGAPEIRICDASSGETRHLLKGHTGFIESLEYSRDGRRLLSASKDGTARLWETTDGREVLVLRPEGVLAECYSAQFTAAETGVLLLFRDGTAQRWDASLPDPTPIWGPGRSR
jgi:WD40 repeat protein